jgi:thioredoxin reductase
MWVIGTGPMSLHLAQWLRDWAPITFHANDAVVPEPEPRQDVQARGVTVEDVAIARITGEADVELRDGRLPSPARLFNATRTTPASPVAEAAKLTSWLEIPV